MSNWDEPDTPDQKIAPADVSSKALTTPSADDQVRSATALQKVGDASAWAMVGEVVGHLIGLAIPDAIVPDGTLGHLVEGWS
jgi:hypothetical protein